MAPPILVVGAGITGLTAALLLAQAGRRVELREASHEPGGLLAPVPFWGQDVDRGSHRVHPESHPLLRTLTAQAQWTTQPRHGRLVLRGRQVEYPPGFRAILRGLGLRTALTMGADATFRPRWNPGAQGSDRGFEQFVRERVGHRAYEAFYRPYVEKVWGEHPSRVSETVAKQRVSTSRPWQALARPDRTFCYPSAGMRGLLATLLASVREAGVLLRFSDPVAAEDLEGRTVVWTAPLGALAPAARLTHRGLYLVHVALLPDAVRAGVDTWYTPESRYWFGRVSAPARFRGHRDADVLCLEIPEGRWGPGRTFDPAELEAQLLDAGVVRRPGVFLAWKQTFVPNVYPMYERGWQDRWRDALEQVRQMRSVWPVGRQGLFLHCNMDHCVAMAAEATDMLLSNAPAAQWLDRAGNWGDVRVRD